MFDIVDMRLRSAAKKREQMASSKPAHWTDLGVAAGQTPVIRAERAADAIASRSAA